MGDERFHKGEAVQPRAIPGLVGRVVTDLYACTPPQVVVSFGVYGASPACIEASQVERVVFDTATQDWRAAAQAQEGSGDA